MILIGLNLTKHFQHRIPTSNPHKFSPENYDIRTYDRFSATPTHLLDDIRHVVLIVLVLQRQRPGDVLAEEFLVDEEDEVVPHVALVQAHDVLLSDGLQELELPQTVVGSEWVVRDDLDDPRSPGPVARLHVADERETTAETHDTTRFYFLP